MQEWHSLPVEKKPVIIVACFRIDKSSSFPLVQRVVSSKRSMRQTIPSLQFSSRSVSTKIRVEPRCRSNRREIIWYEMFYDSVPWHAKRREICRGIKSRIHRQCLFIETSNVEFVPSKWERNRGSTLHRSFGPVLSRESAKLDFPSHKFPGCITLRGNDGRFVRAFRANGFFCFFVRRVRNTAPTLSARSYRAKLLHNRNFHLCPPAYYSRKAGPPRLICNSTIVESRRKHPPTRGWQANHARGNN